APKSASKPAAPVKRALSEDSQFLNSNSEKFVVNGTGVPEVNFDLGDPNITNATVNELFFWFFPSANELARQRDRHLAQRRAGCSSMDGLFQENGPFQWQSGTFEPQPNPFAWTNLTTWCTGLSLAAPGAPAQIKNETDVARGLCWFWKNFIETFEMQGVDVYFTGESYADNVNIPYISSYFLDQNDTTYYNVKGIQINDPSIGSGAPSSGCSRGGRAEACGYNAFMDLALTFPPPGKFPRAYLLRHGQPVALRLRRSRRHLPGRTVRQPCFNFYHITDYCPFLWDELGFPSLGRRAEQLLQPLPTCKRLSTQRTNNVLVGNGNLDYLILSNGTLATLNNMTWNGAQGFSSSPFIDKFFVPYNPTIGDAIAETLFQSDIPTVSVGLVAGGGYFGTTHTERGLTFVTVDHAGHEIPQYVPGAGYRQLEFLLVGNFTGTTAL
ncbi:carboxypeptidase, partial [Mycena alexandri]